MLIRTVTAHAFGPLYGQTLTFADGMTVVHGPNESAKSSWHAAVYAGLCGRRRGAGATAVDRLFEARHKPWDRDEWSVSIQILLDDGRRVELRQDLAGRVDCRAIDLDLGTDLTSEIITDGTPDAARWLGLDRRSFAATASIAQASMLSVLKDPAELQEFLQRAADTAGADTTAARALTRLEDFQRERVGLDRANSTRPLRRAIVAEQEAAQHLADARARRASYEQSLFAVEDLRADARRAQHRLRLHEASGLRARADRLRARADELADLDRRLGGVEPAAATADDDLATRVSAALAAWQESAQLAGPERVLTPTAVPMSTVDAGRSTTYLSGSAGSAALGPALLGTAPAGEPTGRGSFAPPPPFALEPGALAANGATAGAATLTPANGGAAGPAASTPDAGRGTGGPEVGPGVAADGPPAGPGGSGTGLSGVGPGGSGPVAAGAGAVGPGVPAPTRAQSAEVAGLPDDALWELARLLELRREPADPAVKQRIQLARERLTGLEQRRSRGGWLAAGGGLAVLLAVVALVLGQPGVALIGFVLAAAVVGSGLLVGRSDALEPARAELAEAELAHATAEQVAHDVVAQRRAAEARCAALGLPLDPASLRDFARARSAGGQHDQERQRWQDSLVEQRRRAGDRLLHVLAECGLSAPTPAAAEPLLHQWLRDRGERAQRADHDRLLWARRVALLDGRELTAVLAEAAAVAAQATEAEADLAEDELHAVTHVDDEQLRVLRSAAHEASARADEAHGSLTERARTLPPVPEAEEQLIRAQAELAKIRELNEILDLTKGFLASAQERAHRDIAPVLAASVRRSLPAVTQGRYTDVIVDPRTLTVQVCGEQRRWRPADRLSHGTTEQVYLLLRLALADHLVKPGTRCPMLLDDVTVHADAGRVPALLELLRAAANDRQIVLFTQQDQVLDWARQHLDDPRHGVRELTPVPAG